MGSLSPFKDEVSSSAMGAIGVPVMRLVLQTPRRRNPRSLSEYRTKANDRFYGAFNAVIKENAIWTVRSAGHNLYVQGWVTCGN